MGVSQLLGRARARASPKVYAYVYRSTMKGPFRQICSVYESAYDVIFRLSRLD